MPKGAEPVTDLDLNRYLGTWYEIARFDFVHEKGLSHTTAEYSLREDGYIQVVNRGFDYHEQEWTEAEGRACPIDDPTKGRLKVSFFGPFYSAYNIIELDGDYEYALVVGKDRDYIWFLSRYPEMPEHVRLKYMSIASKLGYDLDRLVWVDQD